MAKHSRRKLFLFGKYSLALLLPKKWLVEQGVEIGDEVELEYYSKKGRVIVKLDAKPISSAKKTSKPKSKTAKKSDDWEPIPQI
jgi:bifunctional DNA-binding transcriptional regulator/antitoxin component of YhaV-PrlF toxin-antitoxin module